MCVGVLGRERVTPYCSLESNADKIKSKNAAIIRLSTNFLMLIYEKLDKFVILSQREVIF